MTGWSMEVNYLTYYNRLLLYLCLITVMPDSPNSYRLTLSRDPWAPQGPTESELKRGDSG